MASVKKIEGKNGVSYKITVCSGRDALDRQIRHYKTWKPDKGMTARQIEKELKRVVYEFERSIDYGFQVDNRQTFAEYSEYVYKLREIRGDKPHTLARVKREMKRINEHIGHIKLLDIRPRHLNALYKKLTEPGSNHNWVYAVPVVDFNELCGEDSYRKFAQKCGVYYRLIAKLCKGQQISQKNAAIIEKNLGRKDLFKIVGAGQILSPRTIRTYHSIISVVLEQAVKEMILPYNPATRVTLPPIKNARPSDTLQPDTIQSVLKALETEPIEFRTMITLFIVTGCRRGEIVALKWDKVSLDKKQIKIDCSLGYLPERGIYEGPTKTENTRVVSIPGEMVSLLKKHRIQQMEQRFMMGDLWQDTNLVFTRIDGGPINPGTVNTALDAFCKRHNLPHINPHKFRHTAASLMLSSGVDVLSVSKMLGHRDTTTTLNTYGHIIEEAQVHASERLADVVLRRKEA